MSTAACFASVLATLVIALPAAASVASEGRTFTYTRSIVQHGEYTIDACDLTVSNAAGQVQSSEFKGEFGYGTPCDDFALDASAKFVVRASYAAGLQCIRSESRTLAPATYCNL